MPADVSPTKRLGGSPDQPLQRLAKMFAALSATNAAILRTRSQQELYQQVCEAALHGGNLIGAAILLLEPGTDLLRLVAGAGAGIERLRAARISVCATQPAGQGLAGIAFRTRKPCISNDFLTDARSAAWREAVREAGIGAAAALPLVRASACSGEVGAGSPIRTCATQDATAISDRICNQIRSNSVGNGCSISVGVLIVYLHEAETLDEELVSLLTSMADNVAFALDNLEREAERERAEIAKRRLGKRLAA